MASEQAFVRFQINRLNREEQRLNSHIERLIIARGATILSEKDNVERMIKRAQDELDHVAKTISSYN